MEISLRTEGARTASRRLTEMADRLSDFGPVWTEVKKVVQRHQSGWLSSEGEGSFAPLAASTLRRRRRSHHPLDFSGTMWDSLVGDTGYTYFAPEHYRCEIGTSADWAHWHMYPRSHGSKTTPARPPIQITEGLIRDVGAVLRGHVRGSQMRML